MSIYAYVCDDCSHLANRHTLISVATEGGLYQCPCGCEITQSAPLTGIKRDEYERRKDDLIPIPTTWVRRRTTPPAEEAER